MAEKKNEANQPGPPKSMLREYFESLVVTVIMAVFGMTFILRAVKVPTGSMQNTILIGDHLMVNKFVFGQGKPVPFFPQREIRRGDIIVFKYPGNKIDPTRDLTDPTNKPFETNYVKRVIGLPGDRIEAKGDQVFVNGELLPEQIVVAKSKGQFAPLEVQETLPSTGKEKYKVYYSPATVAAVREGVDPITSPEFHFAVNGVPALVPADSYFCMGDSRDVSLDGRAFGFVPRDLVIRRAMFVYWSYDESAGFDNILISFFKNSRWGRTLTMVK